jgi:hypothetical protein
MNDDYDDDDESASVVGADYGEFSTEATPQPPWHLWGSMAQVRVTAPLNQIGGGSSQQLARINYKRPETWSFWLGCKIIAGTPLVGVDPRTLHINFHLVVGIGRSSWDTNPRQGTWSGQAFDTSFCHMQWNVNFTPGSSNQNQSKWTCQTRGPALNDLDATAPRPLIDSFPAQDVQCNALVTMGDGWNPGDFMLVEVGAFFAPKGHIRPDWFKRRGGRFLGEETGGT